MNTIMSRSLALLAASAALCGSVAQAARPLPVHEKFTGFTAADANSLPSGFLAEAAEGVPLVWNGQDNGSSAVAGFYSYGATSSSERAFGFLEDGSFGDTRLHVEIQNTGETTITQLRVRYNVELWRDGARLNRIRLKYNPDVEDDPGIIPGGYSDLPDLADTPVPVNAGGNVPVDGNTVRTPVDVTIVLTQPLAPGERAWIRWQYSSSGDSGTRDGVGIDDICIEDATPQGTNVTWVGGPGNWTATGGTSWSGGPWDNNGDLNAVFNTGSGAVTLLNPITAVNLEFATAGYVINGAQPLTLRGLIELDGGNATIAAPITGTVGLVKTGPDALFLQTATSTFSGTLAVVEGSLILDGATVPSTNLLYLGEDAFFSSSGDDLTVAGVQGAASAEVDIDGAVLTLDLTSVASYKGEISGAGDVIKTGSGRQRFRNQFKTYTGATTVNGGRLEVTENGVLTGTSAITISNASGTDSELLLQTDVPSFIFTFGPSSPVTTITLQNDGRLAGDNDAILTLANPVVIDSTGGRIYSRSSGTLTLLGALTGTGELRKQGAGTLVLSGNASGYTGQFRSVNGLTVIPTGQTIGASLVRVDEDGGVGGDGTIAGNLEFRDGSFAIFGTGETLTVNGTVTLRANSTVVFSGPAGTVIQSANPIQVQSGVTLIGATVSGNTIVIP
ncbi:hypothetical protein OPIT5_20150 [Opitutaceae bacterium TAV5]|nr:hypothetical protein OPIT5_20150 [Opitutaceae bacterium TAV5]